MTMNIEEIVDRVVAIEEQRRAEIKEQCLPGEFTIELYVERVAAKTGRTISYSTARRQLHDLEKAGVITSRKVGTRALFSEVKKEGGK